MKTYLIADTHFNVDKIETYCQRPDNYTDLLTREWRNAVHDEDVVIHLGDVAIGTYAPWVKTLLRSLPGRKILVRGNHDRKHSTSWWQNNGFDFSCDGMIYQDSWLTHEPYESPNNLPIHTKRNIHGHLHNIWTGFGRIPKWWPRRQRLFAVEYTGYRPVEIQKFISHPKKYQAIPDEF